MRLSSLAIRRPVAVMMLVCTILILGAVSLAGLPLELLPPLNLPVAVALADFPGASPREVEELLTRPLEEALATVPGMKQISSHSRPGSSYIIMEFEWGTSMDFALLDARERLDMVQPFLPVEASSPRLLQADPQLFPVMEVLVHGSKSPAALRTAAVEQIKPRLERVAGVAVADVMGGAREEIHVVTDPLSLLLHGLAPGHLEQALRGATLDLAAGPLRQGNSVLLVRTEGRLASLEEIRDLPLLPLPRGILSLGEAAAVYRVEEPQGGISRFNGQPSVTVSVTKRSGANTVNVAKNTRKALASLAGELPPGMALQVVSDQSAFVNESLRNVLEVGLTGGLLASLVLMLFLQSPASTLAVLFSIPVSIVATFVLMFFGGITLNVISLGGLALGLGIMVDNSIVVLENIFRLYQEGMDGRNAAEEGGGQVAGALVAATLTTVVVFLPVLFLEGVVSQIFNPLALTVSFALIASLFTSLTLVPLFASRFLTSGLIHPPSAGGRRGTLGPLSHLYQKSLAVALLRPWPLLAVALALLGGSLFFLPRIGSEFLPPLDEGTVIVSMEMLPDTPLDVTASRAALVEEKLLHLPEVHGVKASVGTGSSLGMEGLGSLAANQARLEVYLLPQDRGGVPSREAVDSLRELLAAGKDATFKVEESRQASGGGFMENPIRITLRGPDLAVLEALSAEILARVKGVPGLREPAGSFQHRRPELLATIKRDAALQKGVSPVEVAQYLRTVLQGRPVGRILTEFGEEEIFLKVDPRRCGSLDDLKSLPFIPASVPPQTPLAPAGPYIFPHSSPLFPVPLGDLVDLRAGEGPLVITRSNQMRTASIEAQVSGRDVGSVTKQVAGEVAGMELPPGYTLAFEGEQGLMEEAFGDLRLALILSFFLVYMIMAAQFESLRQPFVIMFSLPLALLGVTVGLLLSGRPFSVPVYIGIIMLGGIVVNNGIVMLDHINRRRRQGDELRAAVLEGAGARLRPILMTTLTTFLAMVPLALGAGSGAEIQAPLAVVVAGGLLSSTLLTLFVIPAIYYGLEKK